MGYNKNRVIFRGHNRDFYDGSRAMRYTEKEFFDRILPWENSLTLFDNELSYSFEAYYKEFIGHGFVDIACDGVSLDTPAGAFGYIVGADGVVYSMIAKIEDRNWLHIYNGDLLFEDLDDGRKFLQGVQIFRNMGVKSGTLSSISMQLYKKNIGRKYDSLYPDCKKMIVDDNTGESVYDFLLKGYRTGWNYLKDEHQGQLIKDGIIYDVNSLYPYILAYATLPYGSAKFENGAPTKNLVEMVKEGKFYLFMEIDVEFSIKPGHLPFITLGKSEAPQENGSGEIVISYPELCLLYRQYDIKKIDFKRYVYFSANRGIGKSFVDEFYEKKKNSTSEIERKVYKGILNYLTGSFAKKMTRHNLIKVGEDWQVVTNELKEKSAMYVGFAITSWGRYIIVSEAQKHYDDFIYSDTDSLHLLNRSEGIPTGDEIGKYKIECEYENACYKKRKWYAYKDKEKMHLVTAGIPAKEARKIEEDNFEKTAKELMDMLTD